MSKGTPSLVALAVLSLTAVGQCTATVVYDVSLDTSPLVGHPAGPFSLFFQLTDGALDGNGSNHATLSGFGFGAGGGASGFPIHIGGVAGDLSTSVLITDTGSFNSFIQDFIPGSLLNFRLTLTTNPETGPLNDALLFSVLDGSLMEIPTQGGEFFDVLFAISIDGPSPIPVAFASDPTRDPNAAPGFPIMMSAPQLNAVPEPSTGLLVGLAGLGLVAIRGRLRRR